VEPTAPTASSSTPKPPPPPKCESLDEKCESKSDTLASIAGLSYRFAPPEGWIYAQLKSATIAQADPAGPVLVVSSFAPESAAPALRKQREELLAELCEMVGLTLPPKIAIAQPDESREVAGLKLLFWQREHIKRGEADGSLLVFAGQHEDKELFGLGFVTASDTSKADEAIETSIQSLRLEKGDDDAAQKTEDKDKTP
jgi:hypothetical protein